MTQATFHFAPGRKPPGTSATHGLKWYLNRLTGLRALEVGHRVGKQIKRRSAAWRPFGWTAFDAGYGPLPRLPLQISRPIRNESRLTADWRRVTDAAANGRINLLGMAWPSDRSEDLWHLDPVTRRPWPQSVYCFDINYRGVTGYGDVKYVRELNRLQYLQPIAIYSALENRADLRAFCLRQLESWIDANPPFKGVNWGDGLELALRAISILTVLTFIDDETVGMRLGCKLRACLSAHAYWLYRYPSKHSSANNHLIAEAAGLFLIGTLAPDLPNAERYAAQGRKVLNVEFERQLHQDGVGAEQSPTYTCFTIELYLLCIWIAEQAGQPFPKCVSQRLERAGEYLRWITDTGSNQPRIGDDAEGRVFCSRMEHEPYYVSSILGCVASYLDRPDLAPTPAPPHLRNLIFGTPPRRRRDPEGVRSFDDGGYTIIRRNIAGRNALIVLDHGPLGHLSIAAHGHADALALWMHLDDQPILVDAGTFLYHAASRQWRDHFRSTSAHNTLTLAGASSSTISGAFNWSHKARAWREQPQDAEQEADISACHSGYLRSFGVIHQRKVSVVDHRITVTDTLLGKNTQLPDVEIGFQFHPSLDVSLETGAICVARGSEQVLCMLPDRRLSMSLHHGEANPPRGWYSSRFGEKRPAPQVILRPFRNGVTSWTTQIVLFGEHEFGS